MIVAGGILVATGFGAPIGFLLNGAGAVMLTQDLMSGGRLFADDAAGGVFRGLFTDPLDTIRDALREIGEFVVSIGQAFYDGVRWFVDAVNEYLPILLGLAIIGAALALFFLPIFAQVKLWAMFLELAKGNYKGAAAQAQGLADTASSVVGKLRGR